MTTLTNLDLALKYAKKGIRVFPCKPENKAPRPRNGYYDATTEPDKIRRWWKKNPDDFIGGVCDDTFTVVDVDCGGVCPEEQKKIIRSVMNEAFIAGAVDFHAPMVATKSGGYHVYMKTTNKISRKINYLPAIDILAKGGYVILPDEKVYTSIGKPFHKIKLNTLTDIDFDELEKLHIKHDELRKEVKYQIDLAKGKKPRKPRKKSTRSYQSTEIKEGKENIYERAETIDESIDPDMDLLDEEGKIHIDAYTLDTQMINMLFFNKKIQTKLAQFIGLRVPTENKGALRQKGSLQRSVLVGHADNNPSMGLRWAKVDSHLIARDFSDHHNDGLCDYNVVRLYINKMYGCNMPKPSKAEWTTWFLRLMHDAGIISPVSHIAPDLEAIFGKQKKKIQAIESVFLLDGLKRLHANYSDELPLTKSFMKAWCKGVHPNTSYLAIKEVEKVGLIKHVNTNELSKKKSLYLYTIITDDNKDSTKSVKEKHEEVKASRKEKSLTTILKKKREAVTNDKEDDMPRKMSELEKWLRDDTIDPDAPSNMDEMDRIDAGGWDDIDWEDEDGNEIEVNSSKPP